MITSQEILGTDPLSLLKKLDQLIEGDWYSWEPEVVLHTIGGDLPIQAVDKVMAVKSVAANSNIAFKSPSVFENTVHAFCNNGIEPDVLQPTYLEEIMYAAPYIIEITKYVHGDKTEYNFSPEIAQYVAAVAKFRDWVVLPERLAFAQNTLDRLTGIHEGTKKYDEFKHVIDVVKSMYSGVHSAGADGYKDILAMLEEDTENNNTAKKVIGSYLYDPTIVYGR